MNELELDEMIEWLKDRLPPLTAEEAARATRPQAQEELEARSVHGRDLSLP